MNINVRTLVMGFIAGALATLVFHQGIVFVFKMLGLVPFTPWNLAIAPGPIPVPVLVNQMFWGGLWGVAFAAIGHLIPVANHLLKGFIFGILGPMVIGNGLLIPLIKGGSPYVWAWPAQRLLIVAVLLGTFGLGVALFMRLLEKR